MSKFLATFGVLLFVSFIACCVGSALLQVLAWTRHKREGVSVNPGAMAFTRMPLAPSSAAAHRVRCDTPAFVMA